MATSLSEVLHCRICHSAVIEYCLQTSKQLTSYESYINTSYALSLVSRPCNDLPWCIRSCPRYYYYYHYFVYFSIAIHQECGGECNICYVLQSSVAGYNVFVFAQFPECHPVYDAYPCHSYYPSWISNLYLVISVTRSPQGNCCFKQSDVHFSY